MYCVKRDPQWRCCDHQSAGDRLPSITHWGLLAPLSLLLLSCAATPPAVSSNPAVSSPAPVSSPSPATTPLANAGQSLPIAAQVVIGDQTIQLEVAKTPEQQAMGLMFRTELAPDRGMLFPFNPPRPVSFWMKNVAINLDMVFLRNGTVVDIARQVPPCTTDPCPVYGPAKPVEIDQVIELRGGRAAELGLKVGDRLVVKPM